MDERETLTIDPADASVSSQVKYASSAAGVEEERDRRITEAGGR